MMILETGNTDYTDLNNTDYTDLVAPITQI